MEYNINNFDKICRACGNLLQLHDRRDELRMFTLFDTHFQGTFLVDLMRSFCPTLQILITDDLPKNICKKCVCKLIEFNTFQLQCIEFDKKLQTRNEKKAEKIIISKQNTISNETSPQTTSGVIKNHLSSTKSTITAENGNNHNTTTTTTTEIITIEDDEDNVEQQDKLTDLNESDYMDSDDGDGGDNDINNCNDNDIEECIAGLDDKLKEGFLKGIFICPICNIDYDKLPKLEAHLKSHTKTFEPKLKQTRPIINKPFVCDICQTRYVCLNYLKQHLLNKTCLNKNVRRILKLRTVFECKICLKILSGQFELKAHYQTHDESKTNKCSLCDRKFKKFRDLIKHQKIHRGLHMCTYCKKGYDDEDSLRAHCDTHHHAFKASNSCICPVCGKIYPSGKLVDSHLLTHSNNKRIECSICPLRFHYKSNLKTHMKSHSNVRPYNCDDCSRKYKSKNALQLHASRFHNGERNHICHICGLGCASGIDLYKHKIRGHLHDGEDDNKGHTNVKVTTTKASHANHKQTATEGHAASDDHDTQKNINNENENVGHTDETEQKSYYICICNSKFKCESELLQHITTNECHSINNVDD